MLDSFIVIYCKLTKKAAVYKWSTCVNNYDYRWILIRGCGSWRSNIMDYEVKYMRSIMTASFGVKHYSTLEEAQTELLISCL